MQTHESVHAWSQCCGPSTSFRLNITASSTGRLPKAIAAEGPGSAERTIASAYLVATRDRSPAAPSWSVHTLFDHVSQSDWDGSTRRQEPPAFAGELH